MRLPLRSLWSGRYVTSYMINRLAIDAGRLLFYGTAQD